MKKTEKLSGKVIKGRGDGSKLGFPTANIIPKEDISTLAHGVYSCRVIINGISHKGIAHYGPRAVFGETKPQFEVHILDFDEDIYGVNIEIELLKFTRDTIKFKTVESMVEQIKKDILNIESTSL